MFGRIKAWLTYKWTPVEAPDPALIHAYGATFSTPDGQRVLRHLVDTIYCQVYEGTTPMEAVAYNARRAVVHEILQNIDYSEAPMKYQQEEKPDGT